jgi:hypothetical protein
MVILVVMLSAIVMIFFIPLASRAMKLPTAVAGAWVGTSEFADAAGLAAAQAYVPQMPELLFVAVRKVSYAGVRRHGNAGASGDSGRFRTPTEDPRNDGRPHFPTFPLMGVHIISIPVLATRIIVSTSHPLHRGRCFFRLAFAFRPALAWRPGFARVESGQQIEQKGFGVIPVQLPDAGAGIGKGQDCHESAAQILLDPGSTAPALQSLDGRMGARFAAPDASSLAREDRVGACGAATRP